MVSSVAGDVVGGTALPAQRRCRHLAPDLRWRGADAGTGTGTSLADDATGDDGDASVGRVVNVPVVIAGVALPNAPLPNAAATASPSTITGSASGVR